jgi:tRNA-Thr(GGU) m(6)t(6)A37 methyltransferase TsaA
MKIKPIGIIHSPFKSKQETPIQPFRSKAVGEIEVFKEYERGLDNIESFSHLILIYQFHRSRGFSLKVKPIMDDRLRGLFATRAPRRPNQIGLSVVKLIRRRGNILFVNGIDVIDGTPLLDIKPYVPDFNSGEEVRTCWIAGRTQ